MEHRKITFEQREHEKAWQMSYAFACLLTLTIFFGALAMAYVATGAL
jgi:hypothetical protein